MIELPSSATVARWRERWACDECGLPDRGRDGVPVRWPHPSPRNGALDTYRATDAELRNGCPVHYPPEQGDLR